jgi:alkylation response protein AidB-like acyl-CoA dehydrogenase
MPITDAELVDRAKDLLAKADPGEVDQFTFRGAQFDAGLAWGHSPAGFGGLGIGPGRQVIVDQALRAGGSPYHDLFVNFIGIGMAAPTILQYGTEQMMERHFRPIFTGEHIWCQLFSEPANGSDIAGIPSRAVREKGDGEAGGDWIVNGQKVWTTLAHQASWAMLLTRTDPDVPKHAGLSYFVMDMHSPGVGVRPLTVGVLPARRQMFGDVATQLGPEGLLILAPCEVHARPPRRVGTADDSPRRALWPAPQILINSKNLRGFLERCQAIGPGLI